MAEETQATNGQTRQEMQFPDELLGLPKAPEEEKPDGADELHADDVEDEAVLADGEIEDEESGDETADESSGAMRAVEFAKAAGWKLEEFYSGVTVPINGQDVPLGQALNDAKAQREANEALTRERDELQQKLSQQSVQVPTGQPQVSPEAHELLQTAQNLENQLAQLDEAQWEGYDPAQAANVQVSTMRRIGNLRAQAQAKQAEWMDTRQKEWTKAKDEAERKIRAHIKPWADKDVMEQDWKRIGDAALTRHKITPEEIRATFDHRYVGLLKEWADNLQNIEQVKRKARTVRKVSKNLPAGGSRVPDDGKASREESLRALREARTPRAKSAIRQSMDLGPVPKASQR